MWRDDKVTKKRVRKLNILILYPFYRSLTNLTFNPKQKQKQNVEIKSLIGHM